MSRSGRRAAAAAVGAIACIALATSCGGGSTNDPVAREALVQASLRSAAEKSYVAVVAAGKRPPVTYTYVGPDRLRVQQGDGDNAAIMVQVALAGYHSTPGRPGVFIKRLENVPATDNAPLKNVSALVTRATHVSRKGDVIRFDVAYGDVNAHLLVQLDDKGRIGSADLPVFDQQHKVVSYRRVTFQDYGHAPAVVAPKAGG